jgi:hypothetical protein
MATDLFEQTAYRTLGLEPSAKSSEANPAYAKRAPRAPDKRKLNEARDTIFRYARRLALDALVLVPPVSSSVLDELTEYLDAQKADLALDPVECLMVVPDVAAAIAAPQVTLTVRRDLAESVPVLTLEVDR